MDYKIFTEIGFGNDIFINTEREYEDGSEERIPGFLKMKLKAVYIRIWIKRTVFVLSTKTGFSINKKNRNNVKFLFGLEGVPK